MTEQRRYPSLDGLRAFSILLVIFSHLAGTRGFPLSRMAVEYLDLGTFGVRVFFVISGFLITSLLLGELRETGSIHLPTFFLRRTLRIFPAYYCFLLVITGLWWGGYLELQPGDLVYAATYTSNYHYPMRSWFINHTWSLSVEEQFYLLWPVVLGLVGMSKTVCNGVTVAALCVIAAPVIRMALYTFYPERPVGDTFETAADALATGCLLAMCRERLWGMPAYQRFLTSPAFYLVPLVLIVCSGLHQRPRINYLICYTVMNFGIALILDRYIRFHQGPVGKMLNARPIVYIGVMSYSIYLWQQLFLYSGSSAAVWSFPLNVVGTAGAAAVSYYLVEQPIMAWRKRRFPAATSRTDEKSEPSVALHAE